jgi:SPP1 gp7 family putative phage head morphogenesis protein
MIPNKIIVDSTIRKAVLLMGYSKYVADLVIKKLRSSEAAMRRILLDLFGSGSSSARLLSRLQAAIEGVSNARRLGWSRATGEAIRHMLAMAKTAASPLIQSVNQKLIEPTISTITRRTNSALAAGQNLREWFDSMRDADLRRITANLRISVLSGESIDKLLTRMTGKLSTITTAAANGIRTVLSTVVSAVSDAITRAVAILNPKAFGWELWVSVLDSRTTPECSDLAGRTFRVDEGPRPGFHQHCRSKRVPLLDDGGSYDPGSYAEWIADQPDAFKRYAGTKFYFNDLKPLTLAQVVEFE